MVRKVSLACFYNFLKIFCWYETRRIQSIAKESAKWSNSRKRRGVHVILVIVKALLKNSKQQIGISIRHIINYR